MLQSSFLLALLSASLSSTSLIAKTPPPILVTSENRSTLNGFVIFRRFLGSLSVVFRNLGDSGVELIPVPHDERTNEEVINHCRATPGTGKHAPHQQEKLEKVIQRNPQQEDFQEIHIAENYPVGKPLRVVGNITGLDRSHRSVRRNQEAEEVAQQVCSITYCQVEQYEAQAAQEQSLSPDICSGFEPVQKVREYVSLIKKFINSLY